MSNPARIYVVRHGQSTFNTGQTREDLDSKLTELGKKQSENLGMKFKNIDFAAIFSSELVRTKETAEIINQDRNLEVQENKGINERGFYRYAMHVKREEVDLEEEIMNEMLILNEEKKMKYKHTPDMESAEEGAKRLLNFLQEMGRKYRNKNVLVISHTNLMRSVLTFLEYAKYDELPAGSVKNTGYFVLETDGEDFSVVETHDIEKQKDAIRIW